MVEEQVDKDDMDQQQQQKEDFHTLLNRLYNNPNSPAAFAGIKQLLIEAQKQNAAIKRKDVIEWLEGQRTYTLHRPRRVHFERSRTVPAGYLTDLQVDLADLQKLSEHNAGARFILVGIDVLSKMLFAAPVKSKSSKDMISAFQQLFKQMQMKPHRCFSDKGKEFESAEMKAFFKDEEVEKYKPNSSVVKASICERAIRTLKQRLYRYFSEKQTLKWVDVLPSIVNGINRSISRTHGKRPIDVGFHNAQEVWKKMYGDLELMHRSRYKGKRAPRYKKDDFVRMSKNKGLFHRGYVPSWGDEILEIDSVKRGRKGDPTRYRVRDEHGEEFLGYFYEPDLARVRKTETGGGPSYRIERTLRTRTMKDGTKKYLVKFYDDPKTYWIDDSHFV